MPRLGCDGGDSRRMLHTESWPTPPMAMFGRGAFLMRECAAVQRERERNRMGSRTRAIADGRSYDQRGRESQTRMIDFRARRVDV